MGVEHSLVQVLADEAPVGRAFCAWRVRSINQPVTILNIEVADSNLRRQHQTKMSLRATEGPK